MSPGRIQLKYCFEAKAGMDCIHLHQFIWTTEQHCCTLPAFTFIHKSCYLLNAQHSSSCKNKHMVTHCRSTETRDTASWDYLVLIQKKFSLMGQLLVSTSLFGDSLCVLLCLIRNSSTAAKCKGFPFHCSWLLSLQPLFRDIGISLEAYVTIIVDKETSALAGVFFGKWHWFFPHESQASINCP